MAVQWINKKFLIYPTSQELTTKNGQPYELYTYTEAYQVKFTTSTEGSLDAQDAAGGTPTATIPELGATVTAHGVTYVCSKKDVVATEDHPRIFDVICRFTSDTEPSESAPEARPATYRFGSGSSDELMTWQAASTISPIENRAHDYFDPPVMKAATPYTLMITRFYPYDHTDKLIANLIAYYNDTVNAGDLALFGGASGDFVTWPIDTAKINVTGNRITEGSNKTWQLTFTLRFKWGQYASPLNEAERWTGWQSLRRNEGYSALVNGKSEVLYDGAGRRYSVPQPLNADGTVRDRVANPEVDSIFHRIYRRRDFDALGLFDATTRDWVKLAIT